MAAVSDPDVRALAAQLRVESILCSTAAGSGHPSSSMSAADVMAVLLAKHLRYDWETPDHPGNDHLIFSKGHASPLLYAMFAAAGAISDTELIETFRRAGSRLQGHPTPILPWVDVATGSLGQGLGYGVGIALAGRRLERLPYQVWVLCGDGELAEGSIWEALDKAAHYELGNLTAIVDVNRLGQRGPTELGWDLTAYQARVEAFGARAICIDGHDLDQIDVAMTQARDADQTTVILARTIKGAGFSEIADQEGWHGRAIPADLAERAIVELGGHRPHLTITTAGPDAAPAPAPPASTRAPDLPVYPVGEKVATRLAFGDALAAVGDTDPAVVCLDGEVSNSTHTDRFAAAHPDRFFEIYIAEQQLAATAVGLAVRGFKPFAATFAAFWSRAYDFVRMAAISHANIRLCGSHAGTEIGPDGPSQMALEDIAALRAIPGSTVLYPADATATVHLVAEMADRDGVVYLRTTRGAYPVLYDAAEEFPIGGSKLLRGTEHDQIALLGAGVGVYHCLAAADQLATAGISARVLDMYSIKPVDTDAIRSAAADTGGRLVVVEDHYPQGGLGSAVLEALAPIARPYQVIQLAVRGVPASGRPAETMDAAGITAPHIVRAAHTLVSDQQP